MKKTMTFLTLIWALHSGATSLPLTIQTAQQDQGERLVLANQDGRTLYTFTPDKPNQSTCKDGCAKAWPPVLVTESERTLLKGVLGVTAREDGTQQLTISGQPVYLFAGDQAVGEINGEGLNDIWFVLDINLVRKK